MRIGNTFRSLTAGDTAIGTLCPLCHLGLAEGDEVQMVSSTNVHRTCADAFLARAEFYEQQSSDLQVIPDHTLYDQLVDFLEWLGQFESQAECGALGWLRPTTIEEMNDLDQQFERRQTAIGIPSEAVTSFIM